jgi:hypothetical protein
MTDTFAVPADDLEEAPMDESVQPIFIRKLDRLETTSPNPNGAS